MKNKTFKKTAILITTIMLVGFVVADAANIAALSGNDRYSSLLGKTSAKISGEKNGQQYGNSNSDQKTGNQSSYQNVTKDETVYVITDSKGKQNDIIVSDHLKNKSKLDTIHDSSYLDNIENVKGDEKFKQGANGKLTWKAKGNDIYYQGRTVKDAPVRMNVTYRLDGEIITGEDLQGKSGEVEIEINYKSMPVKKENGSMETVPFLAISGMMAENSNFHDIEVEGGKVIDDGEKSIIACMAMPGFFSGDSLTVGNNTLSNTVKITGIAEEFNVTDIMTVITNDFLDDIDTGALAQLEGLDGKIGLLDSSAKKLTAGSNELYKGLSMLNGKTSKLASGMGILASGSKKVNKGAGQLTEATSQLKTATEKFSAKLSESMGELKNGMSGIKTGASALGKGLKSIQSGVDGKGTTENPGLAAGAASVSAGLNGSGSDAGLAKKLGQAKTTLGETSEALEQAVNVVKSMMNDENLTPEQKEKLNNVLKGVGGAKQGQDRIKDEINMDDINKLAGGASSVSDGIKSIQKGLDGNGTMEDPGLVFVSDIVNFGVDEVCYGLEMATAEKNSLTSAASQIASGASRIAKGQTELYEGADALADGMMQMDSQKGALINGVKQLKSGSGELAEGVKKFYNDGISVLVNMYNNNLKGKAQAINAKVNAGRNYRTFTELADGMDGTVKFVYKTSVADGKKKDNK